LPSRPARSPSRFAHGSFFGRFAVPAWVPGRPECWLGRRNSSDQVLRRTSSVPECERTAGGLPRWCRRNEQGTAAGRGFGTQASGGPGCFFSGFFFFFKKMLRGRAFESVRTRLVIPRRRARLVSVREAARPAVPFPAWRGKAAASLRPSPVGASGGRSSRSHLRHPAPTRWPTWPVVTGPAASFAARAGVTCLVDGGPGGVGPRSAGEDHRGFVHDPTRVARVAGAEPPTSRSFRAIAASCRPAALLGG